MFHKISLLRCKLISGRDKSNLEKRYLPAGLFSKLFQIFRAWLIYNFLYIILIRIIFSYRILFCIGTSDKNQTSGCQPAFKNREDLNIKNAKHGIAGKDS